MSSGLTASALVGLGLVVMTAVAQPPATTTKAADKPADKKAGGKAAAKKAADPLDGLIGAALLHDADVQVARAKVQLAEAELTKARQTVTMKVTTLSAAIEDQKRAVAMAKQLFDLVEVQFKNRSGAFVDVLPAREKYETAKSKLAQLETELKLVTGGGAKAAAGWDDLGAEQDVQRRAAAVGLEWFAKRMAAGGSIETARAQAAASLLALAEREPVKGPMADRIRAALDKPVKLGAKEERVSLGKALQIFKKDAGLDVPVRIPDVLGHTESISIQSGGEELPVGAWLQLFQDTNGGVIYVRDYGLLFTEPKAAPPDAVTLTQLWKQTPDKKEPPKKP